MAEADPMPRLDSLRNERCGDPVRRDPVAHAASSATPRRWLRIALMLALPLALLAGGAWMWLRSGRYITTDNAYVQQDMVSVGPDVSGRVVAVAVGENQRVRAGDLLFRIDPEPYRIALAEADAAVAAARVAVSTLRTEVGGAGIDVDDAAENLRFAEAEHGRQRALMERGFTTRVRFEATEHAVAQARDALRTARSEAARARSALGSGTATNGQPAALQVALASRERAALNLARTAVRAPRDGIVSQSDRLQVGQVLATGVPALSIVAGDGAWIEANYKEIDLAGMAVGQPAEIRLDAYPDLAIRGRVASIGAGTGSEFALLPAQNANGNWVKVTQRVPVRIAIEGRPARSLIAGLSAEVSIDTQGRGRR